MKSPFLGGTYVSRSTNLADNRAVNIYPELVETKEGREVGAFYGCPGIDLLGTIGGGPIRGAYFASNGVLYVASGSKLYSVNSSWVGTSVGSITGLGQVVMVDNGKQLLVVDGSNAWCLVFSTLAFTNPLSATISTVMPMALTYQDGFAVINNVGTNQFYQSNLNDFTIFQALNFSSADSSPDNILAMFDLHREIWIFKTRRTEVWINAGLPGFTFQRLQGIQIPQGIAAVGSVARVGDSVAWLGLDEQGSGVVYFTEGYKATRVSTHAIEFAISGYATIDDAVAYVYQDTGHFFYVLTFPTGNQTFVYDSSTRLWHERASFSNGAFSRHVGNCHAFAYGKHVIGDFQNSNLYAFNNNTFTDNGAARKWLRSWRAFPASTSEFKTARFNAVQIDCQTGINISSSANPQFILRWSDDGGHNWSNEVYADGNRIGSTASRVIFQRLGQTKRGNGYDRIFELSQVDAVPVVLIGADIDMEPT